CARSGVHYAMDYW
nr:immunoglobulin heavy chain junction region [Mus musculus]